MISLDQVKVTPRDQEVLNLLVQGCSNKEIAGQLKISPRTVKQHLRTLFLRAGIREGRKRVKLAIAIFAKEDVPVMTPCERLTPKEIQISILVWEGLTNREIGKIVGTSEQVIKNHLRSAFDKTRRLEPSGTGHVRGQPRRKELAARDRAPGHVTQRSRWGRLAGRFASCLRQLRHPCSLHRINPRLLPGRGDAEPLPLANSDVGPSTRPNSAKPFTMRVAAAGSWLR